MRGVSLLREPLQDEWVTFKEADGPEEVCCDRAAGEGGKGVVVVVGVAVVEGDGHRRSPAAPCLALSSACSKVMMSQCSCSQARCSSKRAGVADAKCLSG
jgi:hypothetical protein